jgi:hydrogenase nickel incorporation protein HypA/HybF
MHEQSLIQDLLKQVDAIRRQHHAVAVSEVRVAIGPMSGVEPLLLASAFDCLSSESAAAGAKFVIDEVALLVQCKSCAQPFEVQDFWFRCPQCGGNVTVIHGDELQLVSVSLQGGDRVREILP